MLTRHCSGSFQFTRRQWLGTVGLHTLGLCFAARTANAAQPALSPLNRFPRMVQEYFVAQVRAAEKAGLEARAALRSRADAEAYVQAVRKMIRLCFGRLPEKTPLKPRVAGVVDRDTYRVEKVLFESRPGFLVTANLYVPRGKKTPLPGVVGACGHSNNGKAADAYQAFAQGLVRRGYVVLVYDPIGQGERLQYTHIDKGRPRPGVGEHLHAGIQQFLVGEFFGTWRAWDGIRALDYLLSRPEVDPKRVAVTGNSGGGTLTAWLCGLDQRWSAAAPGCFITTFRRNLENELPADTEQCPPRALALHLDHDDFLAALAPRPVLILAKEQDFFDVRGSEEAYARLRRLYTLLGHPDDVGLFVGPTPHGYTRENRAAMYRWFNRAAGTPDDRIDPEFVVEKDETLWCTPKGQVADLGSRTVFSFTREKSESMAHGQKVLDGEELRRAVMAALRLPERSGTPEYRILREIEGRRFPKAHFTPYAVETEPGIFALVYRLSQVRIESRPSQDGGPAVLYVAHHSADAELRDEPLVAQLLREEPKATFYACDVRGIGESRPDTCGADQFLAAYGSDYFYAIHSIMLDRPYLGQKIFDVLRVLDWLASFGHREVHLAGRGWGSLPATFAALLHDQVARVSLKNALTSYRDVAESELYAWPLSAFVPGVLEHFDLPDCYRALKIKGLRQIDPWGPNGGPSPEK
jgi:dienelactone hydrolase